MTTHDLIVIGAGPGGYVAAIRAAQLGLNVAIVEREPRLGGTCLRVGCIPSKALLESSERYVQARNHLAEHGIRASGVSLDLRTMLRRKDTIVDELTRGIDGLMKKNRITRYTGHARLAGPRTVEILPVASEPKSARKPAGRKPVAENGAKPERVSATHLILATGSVSADLKGVELDGQNIVTSTEALSFDPVPKHLAVIGAGYIGLELGSVWARLGAKVTVLEYLDRILPGMDSELAADARRVFEQQGLEFRLGSKVTAARAVGRGCVVECEGSAPLKCDRVLLSVGRRPNTTDLGLESAGVRTDDRGRVVVDERFRTSADGVYAIGDLIRGPMLAHKAEEEGLACVEWIVTGHGHVNYAAIPGVVYTNPEIAAVGATEDELKAAGVEYRRGVFHFRANARAKALGETYGKAKLLADARTDRLLGGHVIGAHAGDLIAEVAVAIEFAASAEDLARCSHAHPTLAEITKEAALAVAGRAIHA